MRRGEERRQQVDLRSQLFIVLLSTHKQGRAYKETMRDHEGNMKTVVVWGGLSSALVTITDIHTVIVSSPVM